MSRTGFAVGPGTFGLRAMLAPTAPKRNQSAGASFFIFRNRDTNGTRNQQPNIGKAVENGTLGHALMCKTGPTCVLFKLLVHEEKW